MASGSKSRTFMKRSSSFSGHLKHIPFKSHFNSLTILILSPGPNTKSFKTVLEIENKLNHHNCLQFVFSENIDELLAARSFSFYPDYIFFVLNSENQHCLNVVEDNLEKLDKKFIKFGRVALVNTNCYLTTKMVSEKTNIFCQKYSLLLLNGSVMEPDKCQYLASRMLYLAKSVVGYKTSLPLVMDVPGYDI